MLLHVFLPGRLLEYAENVGHRQIDRGRLGAELAKSAESRAAWVANRQAQVSVKRDALVTEIQKLLRKG